MIKIMQPDAPPDDAGTGTIAYLAARPAQPLITYTQALQLIARIEALPAQQLLLAQAAGCVSAESLRSRLNVPDFDNAAMDGFALRSADTAAARPDQPITLTRVATVAAGDMPGAGLVAGQAIEIMTGAPLPTGCDAVIPLEQAVSDDQDSQVRFAMPAQPGQNVRRAGEDFFADTELVGAGQRLGPEQLMACAAGGLDQVSARPLPRVAVLNTGAELATDGAPSGSGQIRDANGPYLRSALPACGALLTSQSLAGDGIDVISQAIAAAAADADLVITSGGVSAGRFDTVPAAIESLGGTTVFHKLAIRPGKPVLLAQLPEGRWLLGLPGNPMAVAVGLRFIGVPLLRALSGLGAEQWPLATTINPVRKRPGPRFFAKARASVSAQGQLQVEVLPGQESFRILPLAQANCWAVIDEGSESLPVGARVQVAGLYPDRWPASPA